MLSQDMGLQMCLRLTYLNSLLQLLQQRNAGLVLPVAACRHYVPFRGSESHACLRCSALQNRRSG